MPAPQAAEIRGLRDFRNDLRALGKEWPRELRKVNKDVAQEAARLAQARAKSMGGLQARAAPAIKGRAESDAAKLSISGGKAHPYANVAFWGALKRTGWYADSRYAGGTTQHDAWVGARWEPAQFGQGPYAINQALAAYLPRLLDKYAEGIEDLARRAFPD